MASTVRVRGLKELNRDLGKISKDFRKDAITRLRNIGKRVLPTARANAPRLTGELARKTRVSATNRGVAITNPLPQAGLIEYGGSIAPKGARITFESRLFINDAVEQHTDDVEAQLGDLLERIARADGFND